MISSESPKVVAGHGIFKKAKPKMRTAGFLPRKKVPFDSTILAQFG